MTSSVPTAIRTVRPRAPSGLSSTRHSIDLAVDGVDEHEPAPLRRILDGVAQHAPRRPAAQAAPHLLGRGVADREPDRLLGRMSASRSSMCIRQPDVIEIAATTVSSNAAHSQPSLTIGDESCPTSHTATQPAATTM